MKIFNEKLVTRIASAIKENKDEAELSHATADAVAMILNNFTLLTDSARKLGNNGINLLSTKINYPTRQGWTNNYNEENNYDFLGLRKVTFLSEMVYESEVMTAKFEYDKRQVKSIAGFSNLVDRVKSLITTELPEMWLQILSKMLFEGIRDGITDDKGNNRVFPKIFPLNFTDAATTKTSLETLKKVINRLVKISNPIMLRPKPSDFMLIGDTDFKHVLQSDGAYDTTIGGDKTYDLWIGGDALPLFNGVPVRWEPWMKNLYPFMLVKKQLWYFDYGVPTSRNDFIGISTTNYFYAIDIAYRQKLSYWLTKFDGFYAFELQNTFNTDIIASSVIAKEIPTGAKDGILNIEVKINGNDANRSFETQLFDNSGYSYGTPFVISTDANGDFDGIISAFPLESGLYRLEIIDSTTRKYVEITHYIQVFNNSKVGNIVPNETSSTSTSFSIEKQKIRLGKIKVGNRDIEPKMVSNESTKQVSTETKKSNVVIADEDTKEIVDTEQVKEIKLDDLTMKELQELRHKGKISKEEYQTAKTNIKNKK